MKFYQIILVANVLLKQGISFDVKEEGSPGDQPSVVPPLPLRPALNPDSETDYGVDVSFPIHHDHLKKGSYQAKRYDEFMQGCFEKYSKSSCLGSERSRINLNLRQPLAQQNYTDIGFKHMKAPLEVFAPLKKFWDDHHERQQDEAWPQGNTYTNHWMNPTAMLSLESREFREGRRVKAEVWDGVRPILEEWTGEKLVPTSLYGIRVYKTGAMLAPHVDRLPLVTSCIINVAQDLNNPWPVEVYGRDGKAFNVTMMPGDMVLYESHTTVHGRPTPLDGKFFANVFVHFQPVDEMGNPKNEGSSESMRYPPIKNSQNRKNGLRGEASPQASSGEHHEIEYYQMKGHAHLTPEEVEEQQELAAAFATGSTSLHVAAALGDLEAVKQFIAKGEDVLQSDANSWQALHEAARGGHLEVVKELINAGADLGATTFQGGTALWWARQTLGNKHTVVKYLESIGAPDVEATGEL